MSRKTSKEKVPTEWRLRRWPIEPLAAELHRRLGDHHAREAAELLGVNHDSWSRWLRRGYIVGDDLADQLATRLEHHPASLWPDWYAVPVPV